MARNVLNQKQRFLLTNYVQANYSTFAVSDREFAVAATKELGFEVNANHIGAARDVLEIPATKFSAPADTAKLMIERVELLEKRLLGVEDILNRVCTKVGVPGFNKGI